MVYNIDWIIPKLRKPGRIWNCASSFTIAFVGMVTKVISGTTKRDFPEWLNKTTIYNKHVMTQMFERPPSTPLITISNHHSCFDDPGIWGSISVRNLCSRKRLRWALTAHDICFTNMVHSVFFSLGKCIPVVRGNGVYQPAIDFCIEQMELGSWLHIFPEGRVNMTKEEIRFKWGVGRIIYESSKLPLIVPIWHEGMDQILPNTEPYIIRFRKKVALNYGNPINIEEIVNKLRKENAPPEKARKVITDHLQEKLYKLRDETLRLLRNTAEESSDSQKHL